MDNRYSQLETVSFKRLDVRDSSGQRTERAELSAISMELVDNVVSSAIPAVYFTSRQIYLPLEMIRYLSRFLEFEQFRNLLRAMWPNGEGEDIFQERLEELSTRKFEIPFYNGEGIQVEYKYDREEPLADRVLVNLESLSPILGGVMPPDGRKFEAPYVLEDFIRGHVTLHECGDGIHSPCEYIYWNNDLEEAPVCPANHLHHYCPGHVNAWCKYYLSTMIFQREGDYGELVNYSNPERREYLLTGSRTTDLYWIRFAHRKGCPNHDYPLVE